MRIVPQAFYQNSRIKKLLVDGNCSVIYKSTQQQDLDNQRLLAAHALTVVLNGGLMVHTDDGLPTRVEKGQMVLLPKGLYAITDLIPEGGVFEAMVFFFDDALVLEFLKKKQLADVVVYCEPKPTRFSVSLSFSTFIDQLMDLYGEDAEASITKVKLIEALYLIDSRDLQGHFTEKLHELTSRPRKQLESFMSNHFDKPLDIADFAALTGRSVSTFRRDFHKAFSCSPKQWLIQKRLHLAKDLLEGESLSVSAVADQSGYTDLPHFIKSFQKEFHISPKQYALAKRNSSQN